MFLIGLCIASFALPFAVSMFRNLYLLSEYPSMYVTVNGFTENDIATMAVIFAVMAVIGIVLMIFGLIKRRNKAALDSIINDGKQNYCSNCNINVAADAVKCPVCGKSLNNKGE